MAPRIAIPMPHGVDLEYAERAIPQYERAVQLAGGEPVRIALEQSADEVRKAIEGCDGVLLPGSKADVDPARFHAARSPHTAAADPKRDAVDNLLLDDAYRLRKPLLGICYGLQSLNVYRSGSLVQHIPEFLPEAARAKVNHEAGKAVAVAHTVEIDPHSLLAEIATGRFACGDTRPGLSGRAQHGGCGPPEESGVSAEGRNGHNRKEHGRADEDQQWEGHGFSRADENREKDWALAPEGGGLVIPVNSSHHQSADAIGKGLRIVARCHEDGIIEALEGTAPDHFVLAVQWHPERSVDDDEASRAIFGALIEAAQNQK